ncbi:MAG: hypothetical protein O3B41_03540 [Bacteroidetes bacterium]|nr:hypothetical protein [Bacteroidota bacterium]
MKYVICLFFLCPSLLVSAQNKQIFFYMGATQIMEDMTAEAVQEATTDLFTCLSTKSTENGIVAHNDYTQSSAAMTEELLKSFSSSGNDFDRWMAEEKYSDFNFIIVMIGGGVQVINGENNFALGLDMGKIDLNPNVPVDPFSIYVGSSISVVGTTGMVCELIWKTLTDEMAILN